MLHVDERFLKTLGERIALRRKELGVTQVELAAELGCSQQTVANYEAGTRRLPVSFLPPLAEVLALSVDELLGQPAPPKKKRGPPSKLQRQLEQISKLPKSKQRFVSEMLDTVLESAERA